MTKAIGKFLLQPDVVTLLHARLGAQRSWRDFLADCIRDRSSHHGLRLLPDRYVPGRCPRPLYRVEDVDEFIERALIVTPYKPVAVIEIEVEATSPIVPAHWRRTTLPAGVTIR